MTIAEFDLAIRKDMAGVLADLYERLAKYEHTTHPGHWNGKIESVTKALGEAWNDPSPFNVGDLYRHIRAFCEKEAPMILDKKSKLPFYHRERENRFFLAIMGDAPSAVQPKSTLAVEAEQWERELEA